MNIRKITAAAAAFAMLCMAASCSSEGKKSSTKNTPKAVSEPVSESVDGVDANDAVDAVSGDAYLAIADEGFNVQYLGDKDENKSNQLSYDAGIAHIKGNGDYTVSGSTITFCGDDNTKTTDDITGSIDTYGKITVTAPITDPDAAMLFGADEITLVFAPEN